MKPLGFYLIPRMLFMVVKDLFVFVGMVVVCVAMVVLAPIVITAFLCKVICVGIVKLISLLLRFMIKLSKKLNDLFNVCYKCLNYDRERAGEY